MSKPDVEAGQRMFELYASGLEVDLESVVVHKVVKGKVTQIKPYRDLESAKEALR